MLHLEGTLCRVFKELLSMGFSDATLARYFMKDVKELLSMELSNSTLAAYFIEGLKPHLSMKFPCTSHLHDTFSYEHCGKSFCLL
jgi:hypothetical protein